MHVFYRWALKQRPSGCSLLTGSMLSSSTRCTWTKLWRYSSGDDYDYDYGHDVKSVHVDGSKDHKDLIRNITEFNGGMCGAISVFCACRFGCVMLSTQCVSH